MNSYANAFMCGTFQVVSDKIVWQLTNYMSYILFGLLLQNKGRNSDIFIISFQKNASIRHQMEMLKNTEKEVTMTPEIQDTVAILVLHKRE